MDQVIELRGLARFSPRLQLLSRLTRSDDPIVSYGARNLLQDSVARRMGGWYEFTMALVVPLLLIAGLAYIWMEFAHDGTSTTPPQITAVQIITITTAITSAMGFFGFLIGFLVATLPGVTLVSRETEGHTLRFFSLSSDEIFRALTRLQLVSFALPASIYYLVDIIVSTARMFNPTLSAHMFQHVPAWFIWAGPLIGCISMVLMFALFIAGSIYASIRFPSMWTSFAVLCGVAVGYFVIVMILFAINFLIMFQTPGLDTQMDVFHILGALAGPIAALIGLAVMIPLARRAVRMRVMPAK